MTYNQADFIDELSGRGCELVLILCLYVCVFICLSYIILVCLSYHAYVLTYIVYWFRDFHGFTARHDNCIPKHTRLSRDQFPQKIDHPLFLKNLGMIH